MVVTSTKDNQFLFVSIAKNNGIPRSSVGSYMIIPQKVRNTFPMTNRTQGGRMWVSLLDLLNHLIHTETRPISIILL